MVQLLFLTQNITVYDPDMDQVPELDDEENDTSRAMTPDGFYLLELKVGTALKIHPFALLDALYGYDSESTHRLLSEVRVDLPTQIEEEALRFRNGRMQDLGFATPDEAAILFSRPPMRPPPRSLELLDSSVTRLPSVYAGPLIETTLLQQAMSIITDQKCLARLEQEIVWAINSAITAYGEKTQDIKQITNIAERVRDTISLGLESLIAQQEPGNPPDGAAAAAKAVELLDIWGINDLFRHGYAATLDLQKEAQQALHEPRIQAWYNLADTEQSDEPADRQERAFLAALLGRHPMRGGFDLAGAEKIKAFSCLTEIDVAKVRLQRLVANLTQ